MQETSNMVVEIINTVGFPIAVTLGIGWFMTKVWTQSKEEMKSDKEQWYKELAESRAERKGFIEVLNKFNTRFEILESKVDNISEQIMKK